MRDVCPIEFARELREQYNDPYSAAVGCGFVVSVANAAGLDYSGGRIVICGNDTIAEQDWSCTVMLGHLLGRQYAREYDDPDDWADAFALEFAMPAKSMIGVGNRGRIWLENHYCVPTSVLRSRLIQHRVRINQESWDGGYRAISRPPIRINFEVEREWTNTVPLAATMRCDLRDWGLYD